MILLKKYFQIIKFKTNKKKQRQRAYLWEG